MSLWRFSILVNNYFQVSFDVKVIFFEAKIAQTNATGLLVSQVLLNPFFLEQFLADGMLCFVAPVSPRKPSVMEGRIEDTFYKDLKREWRSGSIAVMTDSFKNLPFVVSTKVAFVK